ncbi:hypothetical protein DRJ48_02910 [Candidatus Woesearchaeota archaeon]|nr:hypothetical protein [Candidatus Woesearchaeota archaeon]RLE42739.1 MAG: hypothetical protein DRJ48_02910 [Candidatus Woesearchaeota archaeon]
MGLVEIIKALEQDAHEELLLHGEIVTHKHLSRVFSQEPPLVGLVTKGRVMETWYYGKKPILGIDIYMEGEVFIVPRPKAYSVAYIGLELDNRVCFLSSAQMYEPLRDNPMANRELWELIQKREALAAWKLIQAEIPGYESRVLKELIRLAFKSPSKQRNRFYEVKATQAQLGLLSGVSRVNVTHTIEKLRRGKSVGGYVFRNSLIEKGEKPRATVVRFDANDVKGYLNSLGEEGRIPDVYSL